jgi:hypothetical protein
MCQAEHVWCFSESPYQKESDMNATIVAVDLAKNIFELAGRKLHEEAEKFGASEPLALRDMPVCIRDLSPGQLQTLSHWLEQRRSGWHGMITPVSSEPIALYSSLLALGKHRIIDRPADTERER